MSARRDYVLEVAGALWPESDVRIGPAGSRRPGDRSFLLIPSASDPRLVAPDQARRAAAATASGFAGGRRSTQQALRNGAVSAAVATGVAGLVSRERLIVSAGPGLDDLLASELGEPVLLGLQVTPPRANRKPVLQLLARDGRRIGYAKVGTNPVTRALVIGEGAALAEVSDAALTSLSAPTPLLRTSWREHAVLVSTPLPRGGGSPDAAAVAAAMVELTSVGATADAPVAGSAYATDLIDDLSRLGDSGVALAAALRDHVDGATVSHASGGRVAWGSWHGDWTPWNCASRRGGGLLVWDWERFGHGVPQGYDALHYVLMQRLDGVQNPRPAHASAVVTDAPRLLQPFGGAAAADERAARLVAVLYLAELARRYLRDDQEATGNRLARVHEWILPAMVTAGSLHPGPGATRRAQA